MSKEYVTALRESLEKKHKVLEEVYRLCELQSEIIKEETIDYDAFDRLFDDKDVCIEKIEKLDAGFEAVYQRIKPDLDQNRLLYAADIEAMKREIQAITDIGTKITALEERNKNKITEAINKDRRKMADGKRSVSVAMNYYKSMTGTNANQSLYMDKKN
ncbi:MAG: flagellar protein FlgN [Lachnospiraceae bacterium]|nr:flagellar protein FlgN [Lachnospiraceae bacterium]